MWYETSHSASFDWLFAAIGNIIRDTFFSFFSDSAPGGFFGSLICLLLIWFSVCLFSLFVRGTKKL